MDEDIHEIRLAVNNEECRARVRGGTTLLAFLRETLGLTGTKCGCGYGACGACTVLLDDTPVRSCLVPVRTVSGRRVQTIEGLAANGQLDPVQRAFLKHGAYQCGFCTPGMILEVCGYLTTLSGRTPEPREVGEALRDHICRCGSYQRIIAAVMEAAGQQPGTSE